MGLDTQGAREGLIEGAVEATADAIVYKIVAAIKAWVLNLDDLVSFLITELSNSREFSDKQRLEIMTRVTQRLSQTIQSLPESLKEDAGSGSSQVDA